MGPGGIGGTGPLTKSGTGTLTLTNAGNNWTGGTTISAGTLAVGVANALPAATAVADNGILDLMGFSQQVSGLTGIGTVIDSGGAATLTINNAAADTFAGTITGGNTSLAKSGAGTLTLTSANTYGGGTTISAGTLADGVANALPAATVLADNGILDLMGFSQQVSTLTGAGVVTDSGAAAVFIVNNAAADTFAGTFTSANLGVTKTGIGALTLTGNSGFTGTTTVTAGSLAVNGINSGSPVSVTGGTLTGTGSVANIVATGGSVNPGGVGTVGTLTSSGTGASAFNGSTITIDVNGAAPDAFIQTAGTVNLAGSVLNVNVIAPGATGTTYTILGSPTVTGTFANAPTTGFVITFGGTSYTVTYTLSSVVLTQLATPTLGALTPTQWTVNQPGFTGTIPIATGTGPFSVSAQSGLPAGLTATVTGSAVTFTGTPTVAGTFGNVQITVKDANNLTGSGSFTITINQPPAITSANAATFTVGSAGAFAVTATGLPLPTFTESGALPSGVTFTNATGALAGTPAAGTAGTYPITITAANGVSPNATQSFTLTVLAGTQPPTITGGASTASFTTGVFGTFAFTVSGTPNTFTFTESGALPTGVTFNQATGTLSGTPAGGTAGTYPITITASNGVSPSATQNFTLTVVQAATKINWFAAGSGPGVPNEVKVYKASDSSLLFDFRPFAAGFTGGVNVALGDVDGDGFPDIIVSAATGGAPQVVVIDGSLVKQSTNPLLSPAGGALANLSSVPTAVLASFYAYNQGFTGGVSVGAGRLDGTGKYDVITGAGLGGGPEVKVWQIATGGAALINSPLADFYALSPNFFGGVTVAAGDLEGLNNGTDDLVVGAASHGAPQVVVFRPNGQMISDFFAQFGGNTGVNVAAGDVRGAGFAQLILGAGGGANSLPQVLVERVDQSQLTSFFAYAVGVTTGNAGSFNGGVNVAASSAVSLPSGTGDVLLTGAGLGGSPHLQAFNALTQAEVFDFFAFDQTTRGGVSVG